jgi:hypothetical protein
LGVATTEIKILVGDPRVTLPAALHAEAVDLLVIGQARGAENSPTRARVESTMTETLLGIDGCDVLIVPSARGGSVARVAGGVASLREDASHRHD